MVGFTAAVPVMQNVIFMDNTAQNSPIFGAADAGGMDVVSGSQVLSMNNVFFSQNQTQNTGGAIKLAYDDPSTAPSSIGKMQNVGFEGNSALVSGNAIFCDNSQAIGPFINAIFGQNQTIVGCTVNP